MGVAALLRGHETCDVPADIDRADNSQVTQWLSGHWCSERGTWTPGSVKNAASSSLDLLLEPELPERVEAVAEFADRLAGQFDQRLAAMEVLFGHPLAESVRPSVEQLRHLGGDVRVVVRQLLREHSAERAGQLNRLSNAGFRAATLRGILAAAVVDTEQRFRRGGRAMPAWVAEAHRFFSHLDAIDSE